MENIPEWKREVRARLASARSALLASLLGLSTEILETEVVGEGITATQALLLIAREDQARAAAIEELLRSRELEPPIATDGDLSLPFEIALPELLRTRAELLSALARVPDDLLQTYNGNASVSSWIEECIEHDRISADRFAEWRANLFTRVAPGPIELVTATMRAARKELLTEIARLPADKRPEWRIGTRTLHQALLDIVAWERAVAAALTDPVTPGASRSAGQDSWQATWRSLHDGHQALLRRVESQPRDGLDREAQGQWPAHRTVHDLLRDGIGLDRHLAATIRASHLT